MENSEKNSELLEQSVYSLTQLFDKYKDDVYMLSKTHNYIVKQLPVLLENMQKVHQQRQVRIEEMTNEQDTFIQTFLNNNQYFYIASTEKFFYYDGLHYHLYGEDDILHHILSTISRDRHLMSWKQSTKRNIMKRIKENYPLLRKSIPETETIQFVLDLLCPALFSTRTEAKYFLTILGDNIFRKNASYIHFINTNSKQFIRELNNICQIYVGQGCCQTFKHKYHDHSYDICRLVRIQECVRSENIWNSILKSYILDIICVACHYSIRYGSSDNYVEKFSNDAVLNANVFYLKNTQQTDLVELFIREYLTIIRNREGSLGTESPTTNQTQKKPPHSITWKNMQYLWRRFLDFRQLPNVIFLQSLKGILVEKLNDMYDETTDSFIGVSSKFLPTIQRFLQFWGETVVEDDNENHFEVDELLQLFRKWCENNHETVPNLNEKQIIDLISYFYPNIETEDEKYISKIRNILWDKSMDIQMALDSFKEYNHQFHSGGLQHRVSIFDAYQYYCKYFNNPLFNGTFTLIVSKFYFEKYIAENLSEYIIDDKFLVAEWYMTIPDSSNEIV
jgi:hypothetical protein|uniref:Uncharacterized protein n=1 Tax=viral metagenome TaxID=1070528 RepID=A0A6C0H2B2_9ZZZZ